MPPTLTVHPNMTDPVENSPNSSDGWPTPNPAAMIATELGDIVPLRILVAEDDDDSAESLALLLRLYSHDVEIARSGPAALMAAQSRPFDVVLLDIGLPGLSGYEVAKALQGHGATKRPLIVAITGYGRDGDRQESEDSGIDLHLVKPVAPGLLEGILRRFSQFLRE